MKVTRRSMVSVAVAIMFSTGGVVAAEYGGQETERPETDEAVPHAEQLKEAEPMAEQAVIEEDGQLLRASDVADYDVLDRQGQQLGTISELAIDIRHGQTAYAILELDEPLALEASVEDEAQLQEQDAGEADREEASRFAVPWKAFRVARDGNALELTIDRQQLAQSDPFEDQWEQLNEEQWAARQHETYGFTPYWEAHQRDIDVREDPQEGHLHQEERHEDAERGADVHVEAETGIQVEALSDLMGREIRDPEDEALAEVDDFMIDTREGRLAYAILSYGGILGMGSDIVAVPYQALELDAEEERFVLDADQETLDRLAFDAGEWPDMTDELWTQQVHDAFGQEPYWQVFGYGPPSKVVGEDTEDEVEESDQLKEDIE